MKTIINVRDRVVVIVRKVFTRRNTLVGAAVLLFSSSILLLADQLPKPFNFKDGDVISASQMNANFDMLYNRPLGSLSDIDTTGIANNKILKWNGTKWFMADDAGAGGSTQWSNGTGGAIYYDGGNVGIGTNLPMTRLDVRQGFSTNVLLNIINGSVAGPNGSTLAHFEGLNGTSSVYLDIKTANIASIFQYIALEAGGTETDRLVLQPEGGNVGIGTTIPSYKLDVSGDIRATGSVYYGGSDGSANGTAYNKPDFVFEKDYEVMETDDVERFVNEGKHLPWLIRAEEEDKEGINMTRMSFQTLEALENIQMQVIKLNNRVKALENENQSLKRKLAELSSK